MATISPTVSQSVDIAADAHEVYRLVTDLDVLAQLAVETDSMRWTTGSSAVPGAVFAGTNRNGARRWSTRCTVTDAIDGRLFAFDVDLPLPFTDIARWQYDIAPTESGCRVTESTWDRRNPVFAVVGTLTTGVRDRTAASRTHIAATLDRLKERAERG